MAAPPPVKPLNQRTEEEKAQAKKQDKQSHELLRKLRKVPGNEECADCTARYPGWAVLPHGIFVCTRCAQVHRHIGRHISQTKGVSSGTYLWYPDELEVMKVMGNRNAEKLYCGAANPYPTKPKEGDTPKVVEEFIRDKYERRRWYKEVRQAPSKGTPVPAATHKVAVASPPAAASTPALSVSIPGQQAERPLTPVEFDALYKPNGDGTYSPRAPGDEGTSDFFAAWDLAAAKRSQPKPQPAAPRVSLQPCQATPSTAEWGGGWGWSPVGGATTFPSGGAAATSSTAGKASSGPQPVQTVAVQSAPPAQPAAQSNSFFPPTPPGGSTYDRQSASVMSLYNAPAGAAPQYQRQPQYQQHQQQFTWWR